MFFRQKYYSDSLEFREKETTNQTFELISNKILSAIVVERTRILRVFGPIGLIAIPVDIGRIRVVVGRVK